MQINVTYPNQRIVPELQSVSVNEVFGTNMFWISVKKGTSNFKFEVMLPEWLLELTTFLKNDSEKFEHKKLLLLSGEHFIAEKKGEAIKVRIFDHNKMKVDWLNLTEEEAKLLHARLVYELIKAVEKAAGKPLKIRDLDKLEIGRVA